LAAVLGLFGFAALSAFVLMPWYSRHVYDKAFPVKVPGWQTRLESHPPFDATVADFALMNRKLVESAKSGKDYSHKDSTRKLNNLRVRFVRRDDNVLAEYGKSMNIIDPWGRKDEDGNPQLTTGWHAGDFVYLVWRPDVQLDDTAYAHECGHELHELEARVDMKHEDDEMWTQVVEAGNAAFRAAKARNEKS
jgi:hypothetical protein